MKILVYGFYGKGNMGDQLFIDVFHQLFPDYQLAFTDHIDCNDLIDIDAVFFGGGSFLSERPLIEDAAFVELMASKKIFYLGVGVEASIHQKHLQLISRARMIVTRSPDQADKLRLISSNVKVIPDLVYSLQNRVKLSNRKPRSILVMPNISVVPNRLAPYWKHASWNYFKSEFCQFLDWLIENEYHLTFFPMCTGIEVSDAWAASELVSHMKNRNSSYLKYEECSSIEDITWMVSKHEMLLTQRFHGIVLAEMTRTPYIAIHHHDKLKFVQPGEGILLSYYNSSKQLYIDAFATAQSMIFQQPLPLFSPIYESLAKEVAYLI